MHCRDLLYQKCMMELTIEIVGGKIREILHEPNNNCNEANFRLCCQQSG